MIDGWRGLCVSLVIVSHLVGYRLGGLQAIRPIRDLFWQPELLIPNVALRLVTPMAIIWVQVFFVISGFLITKLLNSEEIRTGAVGIRAFYVRRACRIVPAFGLYILTLLVLRGQGLILAPDEAFVRSGLFVCNLSGFQCSWWLAHSWSLSVEEQFYLCWPLGFVLLGRLDRARVPAICCLLGVLIVASFGVPALTSFAHLAIGALVALSVRAQDWIARVATTPAILAAAAMLVLQPLAYPVPVMESGLVAIRPVLIAVVFFGTVLHDRGGPVLWLVSRSWLASVGLVSYSLYLWQQLSLAPTAWAGDATGAVELYSAHPELMSVLFIPAAILSYHLVERPFVALGHRISAGLLASGPGAGASNSRPTPARDSHAIAKAQFR